MCLFQVEVYEVVSFYYYFDMVWEGDDKFVFLIVCVCDSVVCVFKGVDVLVVVFEVGVDLKKVCIQKVFCIGWCVFVFVVQVGKWVIDNVIEMLICVVFFEGVVDLFVLDYIGLDVYQVVGGY